MSKKQNEIEARAIDTANFIIGSHATVRQAAKEFDVSKTTVHKDIAERLWDYSPSLATEANKILAENKAERALRGGAATRQKYLKQKNKE